MSNTYSTNNVEKQPTKQPTNDKHGAFDNNNKILIQTHLHSRQSMWVCVRSYVYMNVGVCVYVVGFVQ